MKHILFFFFFIFSGLSQAAFVAANRPYDVSHYLLRFEMDPAQNLNSLGAQVEITGRAMDKISEISLDAEKLVIKEVKLKNHSIPLAFEHKDNVLKITLPKPLKKAAHWHLTIKYVAGINVAHQGFFKVTDPDEIDRGPLYFTHFEPLSARTFFPSNDEPYDKATSEVIASVPEKYEVLSNGHRLKDRFSKKGTKTWKEVHWLMEKPHPTYLVALAIGPFSKISSEHKGIPLTVWVGSTKLKFAQYALDVTRQSMQFFEGYLGVKYPWEKYATVGLPTFIWGGMENTSSTHMNQERTLLNDDSSAFERKKITGLAAHELAHQWFGDYVTMKWWDDVWLNESFASLMGSLATQHVFKNQEAMIEGVTDAWNSYFREEDGPRSHPIVDKALDSAEDAFDSTNYTKGENILRMLSFYIGEEKFRKGIELYLKKHGEKNSTYHDLFAAFEKASGEKLGAFRDSWLLKRGYPVISYQGKWNKEKSTYQLTLSQRPNHLEDSHIFDFKIPVTFHRTATPSVEKTVTVKMNQAEVVIEENLDAEPEWVSVNPGAIVLAKLKMVEPDETILTLQAKFDPDALVRIWANFELMNPLLENQSISALAEKTLTQSLQQDRSPYVRIAILENFRRIKTRHLPSGLGDRIFELAQSQFQGSIEKTPLYQSDAHGWSEFRSNLLGSLGKVKNSEVLVFLKSILNNPKLGIDSLGEAAQSVAATGDASAVEILKFAFDTHSSRGYRFKYLINYAYGAFENPKAAQEIEKIAQSAGSDLMGKIGNLVVDNNTLKNSDEWAEFLRQFILKNDRFGEEVKSRILSTIDEVKNSSVKSLLENIAKDSESQRLKEVSKKILKKNFQG